MSWCPFAIKMELQPESDSQPAIVPDQFILHSIVGPWTPERTYEYWRDSTNLESHFGLGYDGRLGQYIGTQTRADANAAANLRPNGHGAVSLESASNLQASDPWTDAQVNTIVRLGLWLHTEHNIPLRKCRSWDDSGFGYHRMFPQWNPNAHSCPGPAREEQFHEVIFPRIVNGQVQEDDVALSDDDVNKVARAVIDRLMAYQVEDPRNEGTQYISFKQLGWWTGADAANARTQAEAALAQARANGAQLTEIRQALAAADLDQLPAEIAAKLNGLKFILEAGA
jgi:hypothetical protein